MSATSSRTRRALPFVALALTLILPAIAFGHVVVFPRSSTVGGREKYFLRVPNEKAVATTKIEIHFPDSAHVSAFEDVAGWKLDILTDSAQRIIGAVWTGSLEPKRFAEFPFIASNPKIAMKLMWSVYQTYADGDKVEWTGDEGSKSPASVTTVAAAPVPSALNGLSKWVSWIALAVSLVALGLGLRPRT